MIWRTTNTLLYLVINVFDLWVVLRYYNKLFIASEVKRAFLYSMYFLFLIVFTLLIQHELEYSNILSIAVWSCMFLPTYKGEKRNKLLYAVILTGFAGFSQAIMYLIIQYNPLSIYSYFIPHFIFFLVLELVTHYQTVKGAKIDFKLLLLLMSVPLMSLFALPCIIMILERINKMPLNEGLAMLVPIAILILYINIIVFYLHDRISTTYEIRKKKNEYVQRLELQRIYYDMLEENQNSIRKINHDLQNNLQTLKELANGRKFDELKIYLDELITSKEEVQDIVNTGNSGIDTILNIKISHAYKYGIEIQRNISIPGNMPIPYSHCISLLGNLLDNAINALKEEESQPKVIKLFLSFQANAFIIQISNKYSETPVKYKKESFFHGLGLGIVKATVELYNGTFDIEDDGENFTVNIILYLEV